MLVARWRAEGDAAFERRSRRAHTSPNATPPATVERVLELRRTLTEAGLDAGADTIVWHLARHHRIEVSRATVYRILRRSGTITPAPNKRPRSSYIRFQADQPNECWQADFTHHRLADGSDVEILCWIDDHSRYAISVTAHRRVTGAIVVNAFAAAIETHGIPASTLTDNGMVFTTRLSGGRGGRNGFETELRRLGVTQKNSRPNHPTTCGKVERFQQTLKKAVVSPVQPGGTRREVLGSDGLPEAERLTGERACQPARGRVQALGTVLWETRVTWRKLDCLNPNLQKMEVHIRRNDA